MPGGAALGWRPVRLHVSLVKLTWTGWPARPALEAAPVLKSARKGVGVAGLSDATCIHATHARGA